ncbi:MAG: ABC transporter permease [Treponema sp.]|nr:ABC transporter permease [Treponema sp.]
MLFKVPAIKRDSGRNMANEIRAVVIGGVLVVMIAAQIAVSPNILISAGTLLDYFIKLMMSVTSIGLIAAGVTLVIITGNNDISSGSIMMVAAIMSCTIAKDLSETMNPAFVGVLAVLVPLIVGLLCGAFNGLLVGVLKLNAFVTTMSTMYAYQGLVMLYNSGKAVWAPDLPVFSFIGHARLFFIPFPIILLALSFMALGFILHRTVFGRKIYAVGGNPLAARFSGIDSRYVVFIAYTAAGLMAGLSGVFVGSWTNSADLLMGTGKEFNAITAVVLGGAALSGGTGTMGGTVLGVLFMGTLEMFYIQFNISVMMQWLIKGILMIAVIYINGALEASQNRRKSS